MNKKSKRSAAAKTAPPLNPRTSLTLGLAALSLLVFLGLDLGTKQWAFDTLSAQRETGDPPLCEADEQGHIYFQRRRTQSVVLIPDYLEFRYAENCGAAFSMLRDAPGLVRSLVFGVAAIAASIALSWMLVQGRGGTLFTISVPLIVSGALGNLIDRLRLGYVVDFIRFHWVNSWEYPTFNVADIAITIGVALLIIDGFREDRRLKAAQAAKAS